MKLEEAGFRGKEKPRELALRDVCFNRMTIVMVTYRSVYSFVDVSKDTRLQNERAAA